MACGTVAVACSGGRDSLALLYLTWQCADALGLRVAALHVHHGLQAVADAWPDAIAQELQRWHLRHPERHPIALKVHRVEGVPPVGTSVEAWARDQRYAALTVMAQTVGTDLVLLGHHREDQAETFLLQALRGAGIAGLSCMPAVRSRGGVAFARPALRFPRSVLLETAQTHELRWLADPSNDDLRWQRNALRHVVMPQLERLVPQAAAQLAAAASHLASSAQAWRERIEDDLSEVFRSVRSDPTHRAAVDLERWTRWSVARREEAVDAWLRRAADRIPRTIARRIAVEWTGQPALRWVWTGGTVFAYRGELSVVLAEMPEEEPSPALPSESRGSEKKPRVANAGALQLQPAQLVPLEPWGWEGALRLRRLSHSDRLDGNHAFWGRELEWPVSLVLRSREPGDQFLLQPRGVRRSLKKQFQAAGIPAWDRHGPVLTSATGDIAWVHGLGWDRAFGAWGEGWIIEWVRRPDKLTGFVCGPEAHAESCP